MEGMERLLSSLPRRVHTLGWAALFPLVMGGCTMYWGVRPWTVAVFAATLALTARAPAHAARLLPVAMIVLGSGAFALAQRGSVLPPGSGTTFGYPLHDWLFTQSIPNGFDLAMGVVMVGSGVWLVPRTIGTHAGLARRNRELIGRVRRLTTTRREAVDSAAAELRRVERDLHDGAQGRLIALGISLRATERLIRTDPEAAVALVAESRENSARALAELRALVRGISPPVLAERGLGDAIAALALDVPVATTADIDLPRQLQPPVAAAVYFAVAEALANAAKHADARGVHIRAVYHDGAVRIEVTDDGTGGADPARGTGLRGVERRLATFDGVLAVSSPPGGPTIVVIEVPCALSSLKTSSC
jgi:signal transduction histidine kinase